jgi:hypothetical protein
MEDIRLRQIVAHFGCGNWSFVATQMPGRNSRQCRERWVNYINPELNHHPLSRAEDLLLESKHEELGPQWQLIATFLPGRSKNLLKNHWISKQRRRAHEHSDWDVKASTLRSNATDATDCRGNIDDPTGQRTCPDDSDAHPGSLSIFDIEFEPEGNDSSDWIFATTSCF